MSEQTSIDQIARDSFHIVIEAEDEYTGCSHPNGKGVTFWCQWNVPVFEDRCPDCRVLQRQIEGYAKDVAATLTARCRALEQEKAGLMSTLKGAGDATTEWMQRCEALTAERDHWKSEYSDAHGTMQLNAASCLSLDAELSTSKSRCQHLEQAVKGMERIIRMLADQQAMPDDWWVAALASLLTAQDETTDQARASFAAGYSTALDDALASKDGKPLA